MDYKKTIKTVLGKRGHMSLVYYRALFQKNPLTKAMKQIVNNKKFYNIHRGERCFILGNGPSLKQVNLKLLQKEMVFTVNYFNKVDDYKIANTNYHFWIDSAFWGARDDMVLDIEEILESYNAIGKENCECFLPVSAYSFLREKGLLKKIKANFLCIDGEIERERRLKVDITSIITPYTTVVQYAIAVAIYMGFSEIYLLGCDSTYLMGLFHKIMNVKDDALHAYRNDNAEKQISEIVGNWSMSEILFDQYRLFLGYERLYKYCTEKGIKLFNCSSQTVVTSVPRMDLEKVLGG